MALPYEGDSEFGRNAAYELNVSEYSKSDD